MTTTQTVTITKGAGTNFDVRFQFDDNIISVLRAHRGWWDREQRCWHVRDAAAAASVGAALAALGFNVIMPTGHGSHRQPTAHRGPDPHIAVLAELLADFGLPAYRALTKITHPDAGGDLVWSQRINLAWEQAQQKRQAG